MRAILGPVAVLLLATGCNSTSEPSARSALLPGRSITCRAMGHDPALEVENEGPGSIEVRWTAQPAAPGDGVWSRLVPGTSMLRSSSGDLVVAEVRSGDEFATVRIVLSRGNRLELGGGEWARVASARPDAPPRADAAAPGLRQDGVFARAARTDPRTMGRARYHTVTS